MNHKIEDYALVGNTYSAALVGRDGSIDWLCLPQFDSPACFAALLGNADNGRWLIQPTEPADCEVSRRYRDGTLVLETCFTSGGDVVIVTDFMPLPRDDGAIELVRIVRGESGRLPMHLSIALRFDYGHIVPWVTHNQGVMQAVAGPDAICLRSPLPLSGRENTTVAEFNVSAGEEIPFVLSWYPSHTSAPSRRDPGRMLEHTEAWWCEWSSRCEAHSDFREPVERSLLTLKALTFRPTGGIVAAPTLSLPEHIGGERNWDYRYCWLRDATFTLYALLTSGYTEEARAWREWLVRAVAGEPAKLQVMYGLDGRRRLDEKELGWLPGYRGSAPVRVGNGAYRQRQMDIYGEVMDAFHCARRHRIDANDEAWQMQKTLLDFLEDHWQDKGAGLWEMRGPNRSFTHSRVMAWVALDRCIKTVENFQLDGPVEKWRKLRDRIHDNVCRECFNTEQNSFVQHEESDAIDASQLLMPLVGFLPPSDKRVIGTVDRVQKELVSDGFVLRYRTDDSNDGLPSGEGAFLICSFWLVDCLSMLGRRKQAQKLFDRLLAIRNDVGLLAEEYDPDKKQMLGNFPQAFSHVGLINSARNLSAHGDHATRRDAHSEPG